MPKEAQPSFIRVPLAIAAVAGTWAGTDLRVLVENFIPGFVHYIEKLVYVLGPVAGAGASATQTWLLRKGASAAVLSTTTAADPAAGATNIKLTSVTGIEVGQWLTLEGPDIVECRQITVVGTAGAGGTGVTVSEGFTEDHANGETARVHANPILAQINLQVADATVGAVTEAEVSAAFDHAGLNKLGDTDGFSLVRAAGGTAYSTEPEGTFYVYARQRAQARI